MLDAVIHSHGVLGLLFFIASIFCILDGLCFKKGFMFICLSGCALVPRPAVLIVVFLVTFCLHVCSLDGFVFCFK